MARYQGDGCFDNVLIKHLTTQNRNSIETTEILEQGVKSVQNY